jgi:hypothetical protein
MRKQTWFGCVVCVLSLIPGYLAGGLAALIFHVSTQFEVGSEPDFYFMRTLFGIEAPGKVVGWILYTAMTAFIRGVATGAVTVLITNYIYKGARIDLAAFVTAGILTGVAAISIFISYMTKGLNPSMLAIVIETVGIWVGFVSVVEHLQKAAKK